MLPAITTTHAIPKNLPSGNVFSEQTSVRCRYCLSVLGVARDHISREALETAHKCVAKRQAKKPAASIPFN